MSDKRELTLDEKDEYIHDEGAYNGTAASVVEQNLGGHTQLKSSLDNLSILEALKAYKKISAIAFLAAVSAALDGYQLNLSGGIVSNKGFIKLMAKPGAKAIDGPYVSAWGGIQSAGQFLGQVGLPPFTDRYGRKVAFYITWVILAASVLAESLTKTWWAWLIAKLLTGLGIGCIQGSLPMYISELAPTQLKGALVNCYTLLFVVGQLMSAVALFELNAKNPLNFRDAIFTQWGMIGGLAIIFFLLPESPWWLVQVGRPEQAQKVLEKYNGGVPGYDAAQQVRIMVATVEEESRQNVEKDNIGTFAILKGTNGYRLLIACLPKVLQQFVGLSVFNTYSTYFFQLAGAANPFLVTVILGCCQLASMFFTIAVVDSIGRRPLTVYGYSITVAAVMGLGIVGFFNYKSAALGSLLIFFACLATASTTAASATGYVYLSEVGSQKYRAKTASWGLAVSNLFSICFSFVVPIMLKGSTATHFKGWSVRASWFFVCTGLPGVIAAWFLLPEIARRTPAEIDELFEKGVKPRQFKKYITDVQYDLAARERAEGKQVTEQVDRA